MNPGEIKILIVEDEGIVAVGLKAALMGFGFIVLPIAISGESAIRIASEHHPDIVLMDITLRGKVNGIEAAMAIMAEHQTPHIYCTAHSDEATLEAARKTSPSAILLKPISEHSIRSAIYEALASHGGNADSGVS